MEKRKKTIWCIIVSVAVLLAIIYFVIRARFRHLRKRLSTEIEDAYSLTEELNAKVSKLLSRQFNTINTLCEQYYDEQSDINLKLLYRQVTQELDTVRSDEMLDEVVETVDQYRDGIIDRIRNSMPSITKDEVHLLGLLLSGLSIKSVAVILKMKPKGVYTKRKRLFDRIKSETSIDLQNASQT